MKFCRGEEIAAFTEKVISRKHQIKPHGFDLTVGKLFAVKKEGAIDLGGSEVKDAMVEELVPQKIREEDKYGWWLLTAGEYMVKFNESIVIPEGHTGIIQALSRTLKAGVIHPTLFFSAGEKVEMTVLSVGKSGFNVKENARISTLRVMGDIKD